MHIMKILSDEIQERCVFIMKLNRTVYFSQERLSNKKPASFPHRNLRKENPKIGNKTVPLHYIEINRSYQGEINKFIAPQQWAYIPIKSHKKSKKLASSTFFKSTDSIHKYSISVLQKMKTTSEVFLQTYLKRKYRKMSRDISPSQCVIFNETRMSRRRHSEQNYLSDYVDRTSERTEQEEILKPKKQQFSKTIKQRQLTQACQNNADIIFKRLHLKQRTQLFDSNLKSKKFTIKMLDRKIKSIQHTFQTVNDSSDFV